MNLRVCSKCSQLIQQNLKDAIMQKKKELFANLILSGTRMKEIESNPKLFNAYLDVKKLLLTDDAKIQVGHLSDTEIDSVLGYLYTFELKMDSEYREIEREKDLLKEILNSIDDMNSYYFIAIYFLLLIPMAAVGFALFEGPFNGFMFAAYALIGLFVNLILSYYFTSYIVNNLKRPIRNEVSEKRWSFPRFPHLKEAEEIILRHYFVEEIESKINDQRGNTNRMKVRQFLCDLSPDGFEREVVRLLRKYGYRGEVTGKVGDFGADAILYDKKGRKVVVQVKQFISGTSIGRPILQQLQGAMVHFQAEKAMLVTMGTFTPQAEDYAHRHGIHIIDGNELIEMAVPNGNEESEKELKK